MSEKNSSSIPISKSIFGCIKFIVISYMISIALLAMVSLVVVYTDVPEKICTPAVMIITYLAPFISSLLTTRRLGKRGFAVGLFVGMLNILIVHLLGVIIFGGRALDSSLLVSLLFGAGVGMTGGIIGVNISKNN